MIKQLISRNLKLYFRDKSAVFFSLLSVIIVIGLFVIFLAQSQIDSIVEKIGDSVTEDKISYLVHSWILAGLLSITTLTSVLGGYGSIVNDKEKRIIMGFKSAPLKSWVYPFANVFTAFVIGVLISVITLIAYTACIYAITGYALSFLQLLKCLGLIVFSSLMNSMLMGLMCSFFKTNGAFASASILIGTVVGFVNGLYVPLGALGNTVRNVLDIFPTLHISSIFRKILTSQSMALVFENAPEQALTDYSLNYGVILQLKDNDIAISTSLIYVTSLALIALVLMVINLRRKQEEI
jgi:multidrug/hemolysin transport system permease protein